MKYNKETIAYKIYKYLLFFNFVEFVYNNITYWPKTLFSMLSCLPHTRFNASCFFFLQLLSFNASYDNIKLA